MGEWYAGACRGRAEEPSRTASCSLDTGEEGGGMEFECLVSLFTWGGRVFVSGGGGGSIEPSGRTPPQKRAQLTGSPKSYRD